MNRRVFISSGLAGISGFLFTKEVKAAVNENQWWEERDFVFEGVHGTEYLWPRDRSIVFKEPNTDKKDLITIWVPTFSILVFNLDQEIRSTIARDKIYNGEDRYLHLIRVKGKANEVGTMMSSKKCYPVIDYWADSEVREQKLLKQRSKDKHIHYIKTNGILG